MFFFLFFFMIEGSGSVYLINGSGTATLQVKNNISTLWCKMCETLKKKLQKNRKSGAYIE
jgi:hypothetical protein